MAVRGIRVVAIATVVYLIDDATGVKYDSKGLDWSKAYPAGSGGLASGGSGGFGFRFAQSFDPAKVTVGLEAGSADMGCSVEGRV